MAHRRIKQRGVANVVSLVLTGAALLLGISACSADEVSGGGEVLGGVQQGLACSDRMPCPEDSECGDWTCAITLAGGECKVAKPAPNDTRCAISTGNGVCVAGACCTGCLVTNKLTGVTTCQPGTSLTQCGGEGVACENCNKGDSCQVYECVEGKRVCDSTPAPDKDPCNDNNACTTNDACGSGRCVGGPAPNCNDNNPCTIDSCDPASGCKHVPREAGSLCDDNNVCNGVSKCEVGAGGIFCKAGTPPICDDGNVCTNDSCDAVTGCKYTNNTAACSDGSLCTLVDKCSGGVCVGSVAPNCDDNEPCTTDTCVAATGCKHTSKADNTTCDDENGCTTGDKCTAGKCAGVGTSCEDTNPCTKTQCEPGVGCSNPNEDNGTPCTFDKCHQNSTCQSGTCSAGDEIDCDDRNPCTADSCDPATGCKHVNVDGGDCSDANLCTTGDQCLAGKCTGTAVVCTAIDDCHVAGACDAMTGQCNDPRAADDTECDDGAGTCQTGKCVGNPSGGAGGAAGEPGVGGQAAGGTGVSEGGEPSVPVGGEGNRPGEGGSGNEPKGGSASGGTDTHNGGESTDPDNVFVRDPGGCSCSVPSSGGGGHAFVAGLALAALLVGRRRSASRGEKRP